jgi:hypothetical protein
MNYGKKKSVAIPKPRPTIGEKNEGLMGSPVVPIPTVKAPKPRPPRVYNGQTGMYSTD